MTQERSGGGSRTRAIVSRAFTHVQDLVYVALGVLLSLSAVALLVQGGIDLFHAVAAGVDVRAVVTLLDRILLALMIVELLYTVQVSFREHTLVPEPFLLVALIAAVRRILVITAEFGAQPRLDVEALRHVMLELALLTLLIVVLVASIVILKRRGQEEPPASHTGSGAGEEGGARASDA
ncbi:phosphate-starvation-inducible PsiE family protein [Anaeromyxobacter oryzisoli]|uniref:phosphate-starvation-inducible PsiE family protein n=1 Tax=Anaeromyxobacter oryzisoli TaxID=2925408 RepID=UPI001F569C14|nr:phosphate-starvation-inducible PsiE family protein [Anaeromyxobacter sp. SG63]